ncbi:MAG: hypothetical protein WCP31_02275 [Chloroflexales bacterium]
MLKLWLEVSDQAVTLKQKLKEAEAALDAQAYARYAKLSFAEIQTLVVDAKWLAAARPERLEQHAFCYDANGGG